MTGTAGSPAQGGRQSQSRRMELDPRTYRMSNGYLPQPLDLDARPAAIIDLGP